MHAFAKNRSPIIVPQRGASSSTNATISISSGDIFYYTYYMWNLLFYNRCHSHNLARSIKAEKSIDWNVAWRDVNCGSIAWSQQIAFAMAIRLGLARHSDRYQALVSRTNETRRLTFYRRYYVTITLPPESAQPLFWSSEWRAHLTNIRQIDASASSREFHNICRFDITYIYNKFSHMEIYLYYIISNDLYLSLFLQFLEWF